MLDKEVHKKIRELDELYTKLERAYDNLSQIRRMLATDISLIEECLDELNITTTGLQRQSNYKD